MAKQFHRQSAGKQFVAYYRVSTNGQGRSGLGLEAQRACVVNYTKRGELVQEFTEVESGKRADRPELHRAIEHAKQIGGTLIIAKLDRLSRNARFIFELRDSGVDFVCCDMPEANTLTIGIFAVLAQHEAEMISKRTREALAAKKARGEKLGNPEHLTDAARRKGTEARMRMARENRANRHATELARAYRSQGLSLPQIAAKLNEGGHKTSTGRAFHPTTIQRLLSR